MHTTKTLGTLLGGILTLGCWIGCSANVSNSKDAQGAPPLLSTDSEPLKETPKPVDPAVVENQKRMELLRAEYNLHEPVVLKHSAEKLSHDEKEMLRHLLKAAEHIEKLHMLQLHPQNLDWRKQLETDGTPIERQLFDRYQMPWCHYNQDKLCVVLKDAGERAIGYGQWPADFAQPDVDGLAGAINAKELLSPFTVVWKTEKGVLSAIPYSRHEPYASQMAVVAAELRAASEYAPHKTLKRFLSSRADAFEADRAFPYDKSDYRWISQRGDWDITVGPYEEIGRAHV